MAASAKPQKEKARKSFTDTTPRLAPRPTAASTARAARNATNRSLVGVQPQKVSPSRTSTAAKAKPVPASHNISPNNFPPKPELKAEDTLKLENVGPSPSSTNIASDLVNEENDLFVIDQSPANDDEVLERQTTLADTEHEIRETATNENFEINSSECNIQEQTIGPSPDAAKSRPVTPGNWSRPSTPKTENRSRPQTPRAKSRPNTPRHRPATCSSIPLPSPRNQRPTSPTSPNKDEGDIKSVFASKQIQFHKMKKDLDLKQQAVLEMFDCLRDLGKRLAQDDSGECKELFQNQELVVFNVGDWTTEEVSQLCRNAAATSAADVALDLIDTSKPIDEGYVCELDDTISQMSSCFANLCIQAFTARQELIDWIKEIIGKYEENCSESMDRIALYNTQGLELLETLRQLKTQSDDALNSVTQLSKRACRERTALIAVGESLVREIARLRHDLEARSVIVNEMREIRAENETAKALEDTRRELEEERAQRNVTKERLAGAESQLRQSRIRISKMDRQLKEAEASIAQLTGTVKSLEDQSRQREVHLEARARKLKESLKTGEVATNHITQQRDSLLEEVKTLKETIEQMTTQHKATVQDLTKTIKELKTHIDKQGSATYSELEQRKAAEANIAELQSIIEELKAKNMELESNRPNPELPTEREMDLWAELQATKDALRTAEEEATACKREKVRFLETLTKIAESENKVGMQQKLAAELLGKEELVSKMQIQIRELTKNIKLNEQKVIQYEQYVRDLQAHARAVVNCKESPNGVSYQDLQQEIMNLRMGLLEAVHRNEELSEILAEREQQLEQQDKTSRAQARVIKVREELINMLKNKETEQSRELSALQQDLEHRMKIVDEVNKQIASKADEIQELFTTLENKQQQIHRLEKIVLALEEQQRRAQAQRTRHEEKIAALEHELAAGNRRDRKFIFF